MKQFKRFACLILVFTVGYVAFSTLSVKADPVTYYFNNAVNTSPSTLGNYWYNFAATVPALELPNFEIDEVSVLNGATFNGDIIFNQFAFNQGTVTGDAQFFDSSENDALIEGDAIFWDSNTYNYGTVEGSKTRHYVLADPLDIEDDYTSDGPWTLIADGVTVNATNGVFDETTTFIETNSGSFILIPRYAQRAFGSSVIIEYGNNLNEASVPALGDFTVRVNGLVNSVTNIDISNATVTLSLSSPVTVIDVVKLDYTPGLNPLKRYDNTDLVDAESGLDVLTYITVPRLMSSGVVVGNKAYFINSSLSRMYVISTETNALINTINVCTSPMTLTAVANKVYVICALEVSVVNATTDTVITNFAVAGFSSLAATVGTKVYVGNGASRTVTVIDSLTDTVQTTIPVGNRPEYLSIIGNKAYVSNIDSGSVSVINTKTNAVITTLNGFGTSLMHSVAIGSKVYVAAYDTNTVKVIDSLTDTVVASIATGAVSDIKAVGAKLYGVKADTSEVVVIDSNTNTISSIIPIASRPLSISSLVVTDERVYLANYDEDSVAVIDAHTDTVLGTTLSAINPGFILTANNKLYVVGTSDTNFDIIDLRSLNGELPNLVSFGSSTPSGSYGPGDIIPITANFGRILNNNSTMTVLLNNGASVVLNNAVGTTLSGNYLVVSGQNTSDLSVASISSASITDLQGNNRTGYSMPSSFDNTSLENPRIIHNIGDQKNIIIGSFVNAIVDSHPSSISQEITIDGNNFVYISNQGSDTVSVVRTIDQTVVATVNVGSQPSGIFPMTISGTIYMYVANEAAGTISVINTSTNTVTDTISVGKGPFHFTSVGTNLYLSNSVSNSVSVIDTSTNTVSATIPVGMNPRGIVSYGTDVFVANYGIQNISGGNYISVIDSLTNTVSSAIILPSNSYGSFGLAVNEDTLYLSNESSDTVSVIDPITKTLTTTVNVGDGPRDILATDSKVYVQNFKAGTISIINASNNALSSSVVVGNAPMGMSIVGNSLYSASYKDNKVVLLNTDTELLRLIPVSIGGGGGGGTIYIPPVIVSGTIGPELNPEIPVTQENKKQQCDSRRNLIKEILVYEKYVIPLIRNLPVTNQQRFAITDFIAYCSDANAHLGEGERAAVIAGYKEAFGKLPLTQVDWKDVDLIASGRWPLAKNPILEKRATNNFKLLFGRTLNFASNGEINALKMMVYGVLQAGPRNLLKEQTALTIFRKTFNILPTLTRHWNIIRMLAYSGINK